MHAGIVEHILLASRLWHASSPRGGGCRALRATASLKRLAPSPPPPSPASLSGEVWRRETEMGGKGGGMRRFLYYFHCFVFSSFSQRTCFAVCEAGQTIKSVFFFSCLFDSSVLAFGQNPKVFFFFSTSNTPTPTILLLNIVQRKLTKH